MLHDATNLNNRRINLVTIGCILLVISAVDLIFTWIYIDKDNYVNGSISLQEISTGINLQSHSNSYTILDNIGPASLFNN